MPDFHGYPQHPDAHPERPWWRRRRGGYWVRTDFALREGHEIAAYDAAHPLPCPPVLCGQVWVWPDDVDEIGPEVPWGDFLTAAMVTAADTRGPLLDGVGVGVWPPPGAVLVYGPHSPWAPMGGEDAG